MTFFHALSHVAFSLAILRLFYLVATTIPWTQLRDASVLKVKRTAIIIATVHLPWEP